MKKVILIIGCLAIMARSYCQVIKIDNGFSITHLNTKKFDALKSNIFSYTGFAGVEYLNKNWFYLSSEIGYLRIGGKEINENLESTNRENYKVSESFNYVQINTTARIKVSYNHVEYYLGAGPYLNALLDPTEFHSHLYDGYETKDINWGIKTEIGFATNIHKVRLGLNGSYLINVSPLGNSPFNLFNYKAISVLLSIGYDID